MSKNKKQPLPVNGDIFVFSSCEHSLKNKGDTAMLLGLVQTLRQSCNVSRKILLFQQSTDVFSGIVDAEGVASPESTIIKVLNEPRRFHNATWLRLLVIFAGMGVLLRAVLFRLMPQTSVKWFRQEKDKVLQQWNKSSILIFSGGGYLNSLWWADGLYAKTFLALAAKIKGAKVLMTSQGFGPFTHVLDRLVVKQLFSVTSYIGVRDDEISRRLVLALYPKAAKRIFHTGDDALRLPAEYVTSVRMLLQNETIFPISENFVAVNFRDSSSYQVGYKSPPFEELAKLLDQIIEKLNINIVFVAISYHAADGDSISADMIIQKMNNPSRVTVIRKELHPSEIKAVIAQALFAIGTSYHFSLFALSQNVPVIGIYHDDYYRGKLLSLYTMYGQQANCVSCVNTEKFALYKLVDNIYCNNSRFREILSVANARMSKRFEIERLPFLTALKDDHGLRLVQECI